MDGELTEILRLLDHTQGLLQTILLGIALQYRSLSIQRCQLLAQAEGTPWEGLEPRAVQTAASLVVLCALFGFQRQAEQLALRGGSDMMDVKLGAASILISLIRLARLQGGSPADLEETLEPAV